jgi:hypothetical protein
MLRIANTRFDSAVVNEPKQGLAAKRR